MDYKAAESKKKRRSRGKKQPQYRRKRGRRTSTENEKLLNLLKPSEQDVMKLLAAQTHIGRPKAHVNMKRYLWKRRQDGVHIINLEKTWAKMVLAARILVTISNPQDICVMSTRTYGQRGAIKFAHYTGSTPMVGKWVPGTFTNPQNKAFFEPRLLLVDDPSTCFAALRETSYVGIPVIALCGTDNNSRFVDCAIPCNNRGKLSVGLMFWLLARELLRMRGDITRASEWKESVDLFFYRDADEIKRQQDAKLLKQQRQKLAQQQAQAYGGASGAGDAADAYGASNVVGDDGMDNMDNMPTYQDWDNQAQPPPQPIEDWAANNQAADDGAAAPQVYSGAAPPQYAAPPPPNTYQQQPEPEFGMMQEEW